MFILIFVCILGVLQGVDGSPYKKASYGDYCGTPFICEDYNAKCVDDPFNTCFVNNFTYPGTSIKVCPTINTTRDVAMPACVGVPEPVSNVQAIIVTRSQNNSEMSLNVTWDAPSKFIGPLTYEIEVYGDFHKPEDPTKLIVGGADEDTFHKVFENLDGKWNYSVYVIAITAAGHSEPHPSVRVTNTRPSFQVDDQIMKPSHSVTSFGMRLCTSCLTNPNQGLVTAAAIIVCDTIRTDKCQESYVNPDAGHSEIKVFKSEDLDLLPTWAVAKDKLFDGPYRTTEDGFFDLIKKEKDSDFHYLVGGGDCDEDDRQTFCNGPVSKESDFRVTVILCNDIGCTEAHSTTETFTTRPASEMNYKAIAVGLAVALACVVLFCIALAFYVICSKRSANDTYKYESASKEQQM